MNHRQIAMKLQGQIHQFSGIFYPHFSKPHTKFIEQMIYGIQAGRDVKLSSIGRSLGEDILLKKTEERLSRHLAVKELGQKVNEVVVEHGARKVHQDTLIIIDPTDIRKHYAKRMPYLARVRDGSTGEIVNGYYSCTAVACEPGRRRIIPLHQRLWSATAPDFKSENAQLLQVVDTLKRATKGRGIYVWDRGADRGKLIKPLLNRQLRFIIRLVGSRHLVFRGRNRKAADLAEGCPMSYAETIVKEVKGEEKSYHIEYGFRRVKLPGREEQLYLVVIKGFGEKPMMLLTNVSVKKTREKLWFIVSSYLSRWLVEETIRFIKQSYHLEDVRVLDYERLKNLVALVLAAAYFSAVWLGESLKLTVLATRVAKVAKRFFGVADFHYYALADGIAMLLSRLGMWTQKSPARKRPLDTPQRVLFAFP
ncbi:MAG: transposase [bacterium]|nr:MAG: transposase [bacterium]